MPGCGARPKSLFYFLRFKRMKQVVLAYSGGLDTTYCLLYRSRIKHMEVPAVTVDTGGFSKEAIKQVEKRARELGEASTKNVAGLDRYYDSCTLTCICETLRT